ncbi:MAG TPA: 2-hydroxyglutaryl-CoA dehydratase [Kofleriaceae bacterium]|nr:2-hydroxyglutaryl-CoA dehydratase [Kofleriaceae bacterium]
MKNESNDKGLSDFAHLTADLDVDAELKKFEAEERKRLGLPASDSVDQWWDDVPSEFTKAQRAHTTVLVCGLTMAHDLFIQSGLRGIGYKVQAMDVPSYDALQYGREFGNRGQCNPTYFTVGNLVKHLTELRDQGMPVEDIVKNYVFVTAGACGPCRFGTYVTEYRKALRDSGFEGFRVLLFQQTGGLKQATGDGVGLEMNPQFFLSVLKAVLIGDVLNALMYRIRPFEVVPGATDAAVEQCKGLLSDAFENNKSVIKTLYQCRRLMGAVKVDRTRTKPKVAIIGEFWAMTTEGDGNYGLQRFLEAEGAEVEVQLVTAWVLYMIWQSQYDTEERAALRGADSGSKFGLDGVDVRKRVASLWAANKFLRGAFQVVANSLGLYDYHLPDMNEMAKVSHEFYDSKLRGGEGHMEVGKLILNIAKNKVNMTLSVKPFGCMPSSSVSDGVQSLITEMYPEGIFLPIETNGDGAVNVYSRVQMQLFKAKQLAKKEVDRALADVGMTMEEVEAYIAKHPKFTSSFHRSAHVGGCTTTDLVYEIAAERNRFKRIANKVTAPWRNRMARKAATEHLLAVARRAGEKMRKQRDGVKVALATGDADDLSRPPVPKGKKVLPVFN